MLLVALAAILTPGSASAGQRIDSHLAHALKEERVPGITWSVVDGMQTSTGAAGLSN